MISCAPPNHIQLQSEHARSNQHEVNLRNIVTKYGLPAPLVGWSFLCEDLSIFVVLHYTVDQVFFDNRLPIALGFGPPCHVQS